MRAVLTLFLLVAALTLRAEGVSWEKTSITVQALPLAEQVEARFRFANAGTVPIEITRVHTSCGCTTAELDKRTYKPGETGEIAASMKVSDDVGVVSKEIYVEWDDGKEHRSTLVFQAKIPEYVHIDPAYTVWEHGESTASKTVELNVVWDQPIHLTGVTTTNPDITAKLKTVEDGQRYELIVTPKSTDDMVYSSILIQSDWPAEKPMVFKTFARVMMDRNKAKPSRLQRVWRWFLELVS